MNPTEEILLKIQSEVSRADADLRKVTDDLQAMRREMDNLSGSKRRVTESTGGLLAKLQPLRGILTDINQGVQLAQFAWNSFMGILNRPIAAAQQMESLRLRLVGLKGSEEAATESYKKMVKIAADTPFDMPGVIQAGVILQSFGQKNEDVLQSMADLAAFMGVDIQMAAAAYGRAFAAGAGAADILRERGVLALIQTRTGIQDLSKLTLPEFRKVITETMTDATGQIAGSSVRLARSWQGMMSNLTDAQTQFMANLGTMVTQSGAVRDVVLRLTSGMKNLADATAEWVTQNGLLIDQRIADILSGISEALIKIDPNWITTLGDGLVSVLDTAKLVVEAFGKIYSIYKTIVEFASSKVQKLEWGALGQSVGFKNITDIDKTLDSIQKKSESVVRGKVENLQKESASVVAVLDNFNHVVGLMSSETNENMNKAIDITKAYVNIKKDEAKVTDTLSKEQQKLLDGYKKQAEALKDSVLLPWEKYNQTITTNQILLEKGLITIEEFNKASLKLADDIRLQENQALQAKTELLKQVSDLEFSLYGTDKEQRIRAIADAQEKLIESLTAAGLESEIDRVTVAYRKMTDEIKTSTIDLTDSIKRGIPAAFSGVILGTRKASEVGSAFFQSLTAQAIESFASILLEKTKFDLKWQVNFQEDLPSYTQTGISRITSMFGRMFSSLTSNLFSFQQNSGGGGGAGGVVNEVLAGRGGVGGVTASNAARVLYPSNFVGPLQPGAVQVASQTAGGAPIIAPAGGGGLGGLISGVAGAAPSAAGLIILSDILSGNTAGGGLRGAAGPIGALAGLAGTGAFASLAPTILSGLTSFSALTGVSTLSALNTVSAIGGATGGVGSGVSTGATVAGATVAKALPVVGWLLAAAMGALNQKKYIDSVNALPRGAATYTDKSMNRRLSRAFAQGAFGKTLGKWIGEAANFIEYIISFGVGGGIQNTIAKGVGLLQVPTGPTEAKRYFDQFTNVKEFKEIFENRGIKDPSFPHQSELPDSHKNLSFPGLPLSALINPYKGRLSGWQGPEDPAVAGSKNKSRDALESLGLLLLAKTQPDGGVRGAFNYGAISEFAGRIFRGADKSGMNEGAFKNAINEIMGGAGGSIENVVQSLNTAVFKGDNINTKFLVDDSGFKLASGSFREGHPVNAGAPIPSILQLYGDAIAEFADALTDLPTMAIETLREMATKGKVEVDAVNEYVKNITAATKKAGELVAETWNTLFQDIGDSETNRLNKELDAIAAEIEARQKKQNDEDIKRQEEANARFKQQAVQNYEKEDHIYRLRLNSIDLQIEQSKRFGNHIAASQLEMERNAIALDHEQQLFARAEQARLDKEAEEREKRDKEDLARLEAKQKEIDDRAAKALTPTEQFMTAIKKSIAEVTMQGIIQGIMQGGLAQVALAPIMGVISEITTLLGDPNATQDQIDAAFNKLDTTVSGALPMFDKVFNFMTKITGALDKAGLLGFLGLEQVPTYATGGIVTKPTLGIVGEAGPEAIIPLSGINALAGFKNINSQLDKARDVGPALAGFKNINSQLDKARDILGKINLTSQLDRARDILGKVGPALTEFKNVNSKVNIHVHLSGAVIADERSATRVAKHVANATMQELRFNALVS